jgi:hypothetical protein
LIRISHLHHLSPLHHTTSANLPTTHLVPHTAHSPPLPFLSTAHLSSTPPVATPATPLSHSPTPHRSFHLTSRHSITIVLPLVMSALCLAAGAMALATTTEHAATHPPIEHDGDRHPTYAIDKSSPGPPTLTSPHHRYHHPTSTLPPPQLPNLHHNLPPLPTPTDPTPTPFPPRSVQPHTTS